MLKSLLLFAALLLCAATAGCDGGVYLPPSVNVPALRQAGQVAVGVNARLFAPQIAAHLTTAVAVSDRVRVAGTLSGGFVRDRRRGVYGELLVGTEQPVNRVLEFGVLGGAGYGDVRAEHPACVDQEDDGFCFVRDGYVDEASARYVRYALQGYVLVRAPKVVHGGGGLRLSLMDMRFREVDDQPWNKHGLPVALEPFAFVRAGARFVQFEAQLRYTGLLNVPHVDNRKVVVPDGLTYVVGLRFVLGPGVASR